MTIRFPGFEPFIVERQILARGRNMYEEDTIGEVLDLGDNEWTIYVASERRNNYEYEVNISIEDGRVVNHDCNCPYHMGPVCKHIVATLYHIRDNGLYIEDASESANSEDEESGEDEEVSEDEEISEDSNKSIDRRINARKKENEMKKNKKEEIKENSNSTMITSTSEMAAQKNLNSQFIDMDYVEKEFHCQICLGDMEEPVSMPCHAHSVCYDCALMLFKHQKREAKGHRLLSCPTCREGSGILKVKKPADLKINLELKRIKEAYEMERKIWVKEREALQGKVEEKDGDSQEKQSKEKLNEKKEENKAADEKSSKQILTEKEVEKLDVKKLEDVAKIVFEGLQKKGMSVSSLLDKFTEGSKEASVSDLNKSNSSINEKGGKENKTEDKDKEKKNLKRRNTEINDASKGERYPLRNLKKLKTNSH